MKPERVWDNSGIELESDDMETKDILGMGASSSEGRLWSQSVPPSPWYVEKGNPHVPKGTYLY